MTSSNLYSKLYDHLDDLPKKRALELCSGHLKGSWSSVTEDDISVTVHQGGLLNRIFLCCNNKSKETVIIRLYGGKMPNSHILKSIGIEGEVLIFHLMSVNEIGPKLLGVFDGGRIEEYKKGSHTLNDEDLMNNEVIACIAKKLARVHGMEVPINKKPRDFIKIAREFFSKHWSSYLGIEQYQKDKSFLQDLSEKDRELIRIACEFDWIEIIKFYEEIVPLIKTKIVFSLHDLDKSNILVSPAEEGDEKVTLIDYEFAGYSSRGYHFRHRRIYGSLLMKGLNLFEREVPYPTEEARRFFIKCYLHEGKRCWKEFHESLDNENNLLLEAEVYDGLYDVFYRGFLTTNQKRLRKIHPGIGFGRFILEFQERKERINQLLKVNNMTDKVLKNSDDNFQ